MICVVADGLLESPLRTAFSPLGAPTAMSNPVRRPPLRGAILQGGKVVGGLDLPALAEAFIEHFDREYARLGLSVVRADQLASPAGQGTPTAPVPPMSPDLSISNP